MAYQVSNEFKEKVYSGDNSYICFLNINGYEVPMSQIQSITISSPIIDDTAQTFYVGSFISQSITIKFKNLNGLDLKSGTEVTLDIGREINGVIESVPIGKYLIDDLGQDYLKTCEITCLDYAVKFMPNIDYSSQFDSDGLIEIDRLLEYICQYFNVELGTYPDTNGDVKIGVYDNTISGKQYISYIAELKGCNAKIGRDGKLYLVPLKNEPVAVINALEGKSWELKEKYEIKNVIYEDAIRKFAYGEDENLQETGIKENTLYIRTDNMYIIADYVVENIYNSLKDLKIYSLNCENYGDISLDSWDIIRYQLGFDENNNPLYYDTLNNNEIVYEMTIMSKVDVNIPTAQQESLVNNVSGNDSTKLKILKTTINQLTGEIELMAKETTELKDNINENYYTINQTERLVLNSSNGVTNTFIEAGGNNIFRNTGLWFEEESTLDLVYPSEEEFPSEELFTGKVQQYEYWVGTANREKNSKAVSGVVITLKQDYFYQEQTVPNGSYSVSFKYKKLNPLSHPKVIINDVEYELDNNTETEFYTGMKDSNENYITQPLEVTNNQLKVEFYCDINNAIEIYDLMVNKGTVRQAWSQNANETATDTVNISKGITITSSSTDTKFKADSDGIRVYKKNASETDEPLTNFTDRGMETNESVIKNFADLCGIQVTKVGDQVWFTKL